MGTLTVGSQPQPIYPDGLQDSFIIRNNGPYTVYVDSDTSISPNSHAIPPTGVMSWDAQRPLYMLGSQLGNSQVTITRNSTPAQFTNATDAVLLTRTDTLDTAIPGSAHLTFPVMESTAFNSLIINLNSPNYFVSTFTGLSNLRAYKGTVRWLDAAGNLLAVDEFKCPAQSSLTISAYQSAVYNPALGCRITMPVKGSFFQLLIDVGWDGAANYTINSTILGSTRSLNPRMTWTPYEFDPQMATALPPTIWDFVSTDGFGAESYALAGGNWQSFIIPGISKKVRLRMLTRSAGTTTGLIYFTDGFSQNNQITPSTSIAAAIFSYVEILVDVPIFQPVMFVVNTPVKNAGVNVAVTLHLEYL